MRVPQKHIMNYELSFAFHKLVDRLEYEYIIQIQKVIS